MAVLAIFTAKGFTKKMYEAIRVELNWEKVHPPGVLAHVSAFDDGGNLHVADVWDSSEALDKFVSTQLMPAMQKVGAPQPTVTVLPAFSVTVYPAAQKFQVK